MAINVKVRMSGKSHAQEKVAGFAAAFLAIYKIPKMRSLALTEAAHEYKEYLFLFPLFLSISLLQKTGFFNALAGLTLFRGQALHIWKARVGPAAAGQPGQLRRAGKSLLVACGDGVALELIELQLEGKKRIGGEAFANGQRLQENETLGDLS